MNTSTCVIFNEPKCFTGTFSGLNRKIYCKICFHLKHNHVPLQPNTELPLEECSKYLCYVI